MGVHGLVRSFAGQRSETFVAAAQGGYCYARAAGRFDASEHGDNPGR